MQRVFLAMGFITLLGCAQGQSKPTSSHFGNIVEIPVDRPEIEPDRVYAGNDTAILEQLRAYHARGPEEDEAVMTELETMGLTKIAPPLLLEYARRQWSQGDEQWDVTFGVANTRMMFDRLTCVDRSAQQFQTVAKLEFSKFKAFDEAYVNLSQERSDEAIRIGLNSGDFFNSEASAWWICSHGVQTMMSAISGKNIALEDWWIGEAGRAKVKEQGQIALANGLNK